MANPFAEAADDLIQGLKLAPLWSSLGWEQVMSRFRRTVLGPFWLSANTLSIAFSLSVVYGGLMGSDYRASFALLLGGILSWSLIGGPLGEAGGLFVGASSTMMSQKLPLSFHVFLAMFRIVINFAAQLIATWLVLLILHLGAPPTWQLIFGLPLTVCTMSLMMLILAFPAARFRDLAQLIGAVVQLMFFITPVIWAPINMSHRQRLMIYYNPLAHLLAVVRQPLLGHAPRPSDWSWSFGTFFVCLLISIVMLALYRKRVIFWL